MADEPEVIAEPIDPSDSSLSEADTGVLPREVVTKIVERERRKAYQKGQEDKMMELQQQVAQAPAPDSGMGGGMPSGAPQAPAQSPVSLTPEDIERIVAERAPQALHDHVNQLKQEHMVNSFATKMQAAEERYPGLGDKLNKLNYGDPALISLVEMANSLENTGDVMQELVSNPSKMIQVLSGVREQPFLAQQQLLSLSNSIKQNQAAMAEDASARDPLSPIKPSANTGLADSSDLSVEDLQRMLSKKR